MPHFPKPNVAAAKHEMAQSILEIKLKTVFNNLNSVNNYSGTTAIFSFGIQ